MDYRIGNIWRFLSHYKYLIVIVVGLLIVGVVDENSFRQRIQYELQISDLKEEIQKYKQQDKAAKKQLKELERNPRSIEKIARERYFMKADDEDIYQLSDDEKPLDNQDETTK